MTEKEQLIRVLATMRTDILQKKLAMEMVRRRMDDMDLRMLSDYSHRVVVDMRDSVDLLDYIIEELNKLDDAGD